LLVWFVAAPVLVLTALAATAQDHLLEVKNNLQSEMSACFVYYTITKNCAVAERDDAVIDGLTNIQDTFSQEMAKLGKSIGMIDEAMVARVRIFSDEQYGSIPNSCVNLSAPMVKHGNRCKQVGENPDPEDRPYSLP